MKMALTSSKTPVTAMPRSRKGSKMSQMIGNRISTSRASGQQITNRMHQSRKVIIGVRYGFLAREVAVGQFEIATGR